MNQLVLPQVQQVQLNQLLHENQLVLLRALEYLDVPYFLVYLVYLVIHMVQLIHYFLVILLLPFSLVVLSDREYLEYLVVQ
jgi:hypothetical protein